jgi:hypothetical protein
MSENQSEFERELEEAMEPVLRGSVPTASRPDPQARQRQPEGKPTQGLVSSHVEQVGKLLDVMLKSATQLEAEIAEKQDRLRQTRVSIEAFRLAHQRLRP